MRVFVWFINLIFLLTLSCSSFLWEYWYLLIPGICNLGHGNHHWVAISKTLHLQNAYYEYSKFVLVASFFDHIVSVHTYFLFYFVQINITNYHVAFIFSNFEGARSARKHFWNPLGILELNPNVNTLGHGLLYIWTELLYLTCPHEADLW